MASLEDVGQRILSQKECWARVLVGGLMCLTVIAAPFALGYLFRYAYQVRERGDVSLPPWEDWGRLYVLGLMFLGVWLAWFVLPLFLAWIVSLLLAALTFGLIGAIAWLPVAAVFLLVPACFVSALSHFQRHRQWQSVLDFNAITRPLRQIAWRVPVGGLFLAGLWILGLPLFPFAFFLGFIILLPYYLIIFIRTQHENVYL